LAKVPNPLDEFQSHSVHYVLLAARSTEALRPFTDGSADAMSSSLQAIDNCKVLGGEVFASAASAAAYLVLDTRRFSQFAVQNFSLSTIIAGLKIPGSQTPNAVGVDMTFDVLDSSGIAFANFLQYLMDQKLGVSQQGMSILMRVLFIGHLADGSTKVVQSIGIPAIFDKIALDLNEVKGIYSCKCFPLIGMSSNSQHNVAWSSIGTASNYFTGPSANTLGAVVRSFEKRLNDESITRYNQQNVQAQTAGGPAVPQARFGRQVQYMITLPPAWEDFAFSGPAQGGASEINFKALIAAEETKRTQTAQQAQKTAQANTTAQAKDSFVAVNPDLSVTEVLDVIFSQTLGVQQLGNFKSDQSKNTEIKFFKHLITVTSDDDSFTVHIDVVEFIVPNVDLSASGSAVSENDKLLYETVPATDTQAEKRVPRNYLEYDYIYSGKNLDVLHLDLKIENFNIMLMQGRKLGQGELYVTADDGQKQTDGETTSSDSRVSQGMRPKDPVLLPRRTQAERSNFNQLSAAAQTADGTTPQAVVQQYTRNLANFYSLGVGVAAKLELRGNPDIMVGVSLTAIPKHVSAITVGSSNTSSTNEAVKTQYRKDFEANLLKLVPQLQSRADGFVLTGPAVPASPVFMKVNVFGPNTTLLGEMIEGQNFATQLFYDNYYYVSRITSKVEGTKFTQEFDLLPYTVFGFTSTSAQGPTAAPRSTK
jgi:hypothetical protein